MLALLIGMGSNLSCPISGQAANNLQTYTQPFQNSTTTLSGDAVEANMYFIKMDYWQVKKVTINLNFQISQLANRETSDITLSLNGTKFYSFRPKKETGLQTRAIEVPLRLIQGENQLKISGQILNKKGQQSSQLVQTPANWLTIYNGRMLTLSIACNPQQRLLNLFMRIFLGLIPSRMLIQS